MLQYSEACERNKEPILEILRDELQNVRTVLEIGSGTAQHAVFFAKHLPHLVWYTSDLPKNIPPIEARLAAEGSENIRAPIELNVSHHPWETEPVDCIFTANTLHIISWQHVNELFNGAGYTLKPRGKLCIYGPFKYHGNFTSPSNAQFDSWLKERDPSSGIRDIEVVSSLAEHQGLYLKADYDMPANNRLIVWQKGSQVI